MEHQQKINIKPKLGQRFKGEKHMIMIDRKNGIKRAEYCGPGTNVEDRDRLGIQPLNETDNVCKKHDKDYIRIIETKLDMVRKGKMVRKADEDMIKRLENLRNPNAFIARNAIKIKMKAEDLGLIKNTRFISY